MQRCWWARLSTPWDRCATLNSRLCLKDSTCQMVISLPQCATRSCTTEILSISMESCIRQDSLGMPTICRHSSEIRRSPGFVAQHKRPPVAASHSSPTSLLMPLTSPPSQPHGVSPAASSCAFRLGKDYPHTSLAGTLAPRFQVKPRHGSRHTTISQPVRDSTRGRVTRPSKCASFFYLQESLGLSEQMCRLIHLQAMA